MHTRVAETKACQGIEHGQWGSQLAMDMVDRITAGNEHDRYVLQLAINIVGEGNEHGQ